MTSRPAPQHHPVSRVLERLPGVRQTAPDRWLAPCPAHNDRTPSLSLRECTDGTLLVRCWAGCEVRAIVEALGMQLKDLFPCRVTDRTRLRDATRLPARDAMTLLRYEARVIQVAAHAVAEGHPLAAAELQRLDAAIGRIDAVWGAANAR